MKKALLIDDDAEFRGLLAQLLEPKGWEILQASNGEEGLGLAETHAPDIILCDLMMPQCNGFAVARTVRGNPDLQHTGIIITTGSHYSTDHIHALECGADEFLVKPITLANLLEAIERATTKQASDRAPTQHPASMSAIQAAHRPIKFSESPGTAAGNIIRFWGVRGSIPSPGPQTNFYGGNTACVELRVDGELIVLDAGTGIRPLGQRLASEFRDQPIHLSLLISHTHWDHIQGFPFFLPAYNPANQLDIIGYEGSRNGLQSVLTSQMESPYFPIGLKQMPGNIRFTEFKEFDFHVGPVRVTATFANHPGICIGYRLHTSTGDVVYLPDNEPYERLRDHSISGSSDAERFARSQDDRLIQFVRGADVLIIDAQYNADEYERHVGWGHGCVDDVVALAMMADVKRLFLFHHDPGHDDAEISRMVAWARRIAQQARSPLRVEAARENSEIVLKLEPKNKA